jgi:Carbohydrate esterase, sialic acid-specific acetylesterase/GDSL-like Lipase/Acylhydrolase family
MMKSRINNGLMMALIVGCGAALGAEAQRPVKVFILAGDENCLEQGVVAGRTAGMDVICFTNDVPVKDEVARLVVCSVYKERYTPGINYDTLTPVVTKPVAFGEQLGKKKNPSFVPASFPEQAQQEGMTTVLRGYLMVNRSGKYEVRPGTGDSAYNITTLQGQEVYRLTTGQTNPVCAVIPLETRKRYAFQIIYLGKPSPDLKVPQVEIPGALETVMAGTRDYAFLKDGKGQWVKRDDVTLYDAHPLHNNTRAPGRPLGIPEDPADPAYRMGPELMLGHILGNAYEDPVFLLRFATRHPIGFLKGSRSLGLDYLPPSSGGDTAQQGNWDVIHFNFGVWDAGYKDVSSKYYQGHGNTTSVTDFEKNLRALVARMKQTGATVIWASVTPVWKGEPGKPNADVVAYNAVAEKVMKENGVIIDDLHALVPKGTGSWVDPNVHSVGNLAPHVTKTILEALASRKESTKPLPRVLMIGDSITGGYLGGVMKSLDGKAAVFKNPGNAESTWTGLRKIDEWLDLKTYLQSGQEYLELVNGVNDSLAQLPRFFPGYQKQGYEIAGLIWFQGIADSQSPACSSAYEMNLANLIHDLRRDLKAPAMPVAVAVIASGSEKVREGQSAIGNPEKHPELKGTVSSVETKPFCYTDSQSPGGHPSCYFSNAESFLKIGEALGRAMLALPRQPSK